MFSDILYYNCNVLYYPVYFIIFLLAEKMYDFLDKSLLLVLHIGISRPKHPVLSPSVCSFPLHPKVLEASEQCEFSQSDMCSTGDPLPK